MSSIHGIKCTNFQLQEQAEEQNTKADQIAGELASLREKLQELITKVTST